MLIEELSMQRGRFVSATPPYMIYLLITVMHKISLAIFRQNHSDRRNICCKMTKHFLKYSLTLMLFISIIREIHPLEPQRHRHSMLAPRVCAPRVMRCSLGHVI